MTMTVALIQYSRNRGEGASTFSKAPEYNFTLFVPRGPSVCFGEGARWGGGEGGEGGGCWRCHDAPALKHALTRRIQYSSKNSVLRAIRGALSEIANFKFLYY